jgi:F0F1-type ATP synthase assembly protein I
VVAFIAKQAASNMGLASLPACTSTKEITQNLSLVAQGKVNEISCYSPEVRTVLEKAAGVAAPKIAQSQLAQQLDALLTKYQFKAITNDIFNAVLSISKFKQNLYTLRDVVAQSRTRAMQMLGISFLLLIAGLLLTERRRLKTFFLTYLWAGGIMTMGAFIYVYAAYQSISRNMPIRVLAISDPAVSEAQKLALTKSLETAAAMIARGMMQYTLYAGLILVMGSLLGLSILFIKDKYFTQPVPAEIPVKKSKPVKTAKKI